MAKKPEPKPETTLEHDHTAFIDPAEGFPSAALLAEIRAKTREFSVFEAQYPSIANAARHIGPALGLGPINTAEAILLWQHWIGLAD